MSSDGLGCQYHRDVEAVAGGGQETKPAIETLRGIGDVDAEREDFVAGPDFFGEGAEEGSADALVAIAVEQGYVDDMDFGGRASEEEAARGDAVDSDDGVFGGRKLGGVAHLADAVLHVEDLAAGRLGECGEFRGADLAEEVLQEGFVGDAGGDESEWHECERIACFRWRSRGTQRMRVNPLPEDGLGCPARANFLTLKNDRIIAIISLQFITHSVKVTSA